MSTLTVRCDGCDALLPLSMRNHAVFAHHRTLPQEGFEAAIDSACRRATLVTAAAGCTPITPASAHSLGGRTPGLQATPHNPSFTPRPVHADVSSAEGTSLEERILDRIHEVCTPHATRPGGSSGSGGGGGGNPPPAAAAPLTSRASHLASLTVAREPQLGRASTTSGVAGGDGGMQPRRLAPTPAPVLASARRSSVFKV